MNIKLLISVIALAISVISLFISISYKKPETVQPIADSRVADIAGFKDNICIGTDVIAYIRRHCGNDKADLNEKAFVVVEGLNDKNMVLYANTEDGYNYSPGQYHISGVNNVFRNGIYDLLKELTGLGGSSIVKTDKYYIEYADLNDIIRVRFVKQ